MNGEDCVPRRTCPECNKRTWNPLILGQLPMFIVRNSSEFTVIILASRGKKTRRHTADLNSALKIREKLEKTALIVEVKSLLEKFKAKRRDARAAAKKKMNMSTKRPTNEQEAAKNAKKTPKNEK